MGNYTPSVDDNLLGIADRNALNEEEAKGIIKAWQCILDMDDAQEISVSILLNIHKVAFEHLYEWAGKWRRSDFKVGQHTPPGYAQVPPLMYQFLEQVNYQMRQLSNSEDLVKLLAYTHHKMVHIHPFVNGNGRTARLVTDLVAMLKGYDNIILYHREGKERTIYLEAIRAADQNDYKKLEDLIRQQLRPLD